MKWGERCWNRSCYTDLLAAPGSAQASRIQGGMARSWGLESQTLQGLAQQWRKESGGLRQGGSSITLPATKLRVLYLHLAWHSVAPAGQIAPSLSPAPPILPHSSYDPLVLQGPGDQPACIGTNPISTHTAAQSLLPFKHHPYWSCSVGFIPVIFIGMC